MDSSGEAAPKLSHAASGEEEASVDAQSAALLARLDAMLAAPPPPGLAGIEAARAKASEIFAAFAGPPEDGDCIFHDTGARGAGRAIPARLYRPLSRRGAPAPMIVFFHGGGWSLGALDDYDGLLRSLAVMSGAIIASIDYRRAPEHPFPAGLEDAVAATAFFAEAAADFGADPRRLAVMGDSAGGNLAAVVAHEARRTGGPSIRAQFLLYPMLDMIRPHTAYHSRLLFGDGAHFLTHAALDASLADYLGDPAMAGDPRVSPINEPDLAGMPATFIVVGECDPLRDEAFAYASRLKDAGAEVSLTCVAGAIHAFLSFGVLDVARRARRRLAADMERSLADRG